MSLLNTSSWKRYVSCSLLAISLGFACSGGDDDDDNNEPDEVVVIDPAGTHTTYVISELKLPNNPTTSRNYGFDFNKDGVVDNRLGGLLATLSEQGLELQPEVDEQLNAGSFIILASIKATDLVNANGVGAYVFFGDNPSPVACDDPDVPATCGKHLGGDATFDVAENSPTDAVVTGALAAGEMDAGPGTVKIAFPLSTTELLEISLVGARIEATVSADGWTSAKLVGAISLDEIDNKLIPAVHGVIAELVADSCTANPEGSDEPCTCVGSTGAEQLQGFFDKSPVDCLLSLEEVKDSPVLGSLLAPDLDLYDADGKYNPNNGDGAPDALSLGLGLTAVPASFEIPAAAK